MGSCLTLKYELFNRDVATVVFYIPNFLVVQEEDHDVVEHCGRMPVRGKPLVLPVWSPGVRGARLVEAGPQQTSHLEARGRENSLVLTEGKR